MLRDAGWALVLAVVLGLQAWRLDRIERADPDRSYHLALSRIAASEGLVIERIPSIVGLGWDQHFDEKEWLFHQLTGLAWRLGGPTAVEALCFLFSWAAVVLVFLLARRAQAGPLPAALVAVLCLGSSLFVFRVLMVRPQVLALVWALTLVHALLSKKPWAVVLASALFAWSYHALYLPLALATAWSAHLALRREPRAWTWAVLTLAGLTLGTVISPAFPGNAWSTWVGWKIAWTTAGDAASAAENLPLPWLEWLLAFGAGAGGFAFAAWKGRGEHDERRFFLVVAGVFWVLSLRNPRAGEYAVPLTAVAMAFVLRPSRATWALCGLVALGFIPGQLRLTNVLPIHTYLEGTARSVEALPATGDDPVFNCAFADGAYLLYQRPNLRFIDVLDPMLLKAKRPEFAAAREAMWRGEREPWDVLAEHFPARFVVCGYPAAREKLERDPRFRRLHPPAGQPGPRSSGPPVYEVVDYVPSASRSAK